MVAEVQANTNRILCTHVGSLPRPEDLLGMLRGQAAGEPVEEEAFRDCLGRAVREVVARQMEVGIDLVNDGEMGKISYATYVSERLSGFGGAQREGHIAQDLQEYRRLARRLVDMDTVIPDTNGASCIGPVASADLRPLERDLECFREALGALQPVGSFMTSASPGIVSVFQRNEYYPGEPEYIEAVAEAMRTEYEAIANAGHILQLDCPDLAMNRHLGFAGQAEGEFLRRAELYVEAINHATRNIPAQRMRMHLCWGNYQGPHHHDIALQKILPIVLKARPATICLEGANPRHAHEWVVFRDTPLPADKMLAPGLLDSCTNYVEHPEWIAQRLCQYAELVDPAQLIAGSDCGFSTFAGYPTVDPDVVWLKLRALAEGAALASARLF